MSNGWWVSSLIESQGVHVLVAWVFWVVLSIVLHELAHGWAALWRGDTTPRDTGHMTINPFVHMPPMAWLMFALVGITWGYMPVDPSRMRGRYADAIVSAAGPAMNVLLFAVAVVLHTAWVAIAGGHWFSGLSVTPDLLENTRQFFWYGAALNLALAMLNLIPAPPLDGSRILADLVPAFRSLVERMQGSPLAFVPLIIVLLVVSRVLLPVAVDATNQSMVFLLRLSAPGALADAPVAP